MKNALFAATLVAGLLAGAPVETPVFNLPLPLRQENWLGPKRSGSCVHASFVMLLRWQGQYQWADFWKKTYADGEYYDRFCERLDKHEIVYASINGTYDPSFLEWAIKTRRGCMVTCMNGAHMVILAHLDANRAGILDNNDIGKIHWYPRETFLREWRNSGCWALTPLYSPAPPPLKRK